MTNPSINTKKEFIQFLAINNISLEQIIKERCNVDWDYNAKTFDEMGLDDLDIVEVIMDIEKNYDCFIAELLMFLEGISVIHVEADGSKTLYRVQIRVTTHILDMPALCKFFNVENVLN